MLKNVKYLLGVIALTATTISFADTSVQMKLTAEKGTGKSIGTIKITETDHGLLFTPNLHDLTPGIHGFHIHQKDSCAQNGMAAGGHLDPKNTEKHLGPFDDDGHLGDLPPLYVSAVGTSTLPVLAPRLTKIDDIKNHTLMIHNGGDNYSDKPEKLGGGDGRMVCGVIG
ncbi:MAG: superoxide dismutase [Cu-Zn] SodC [Gammaproteobacteria bacterium]